jgi:hypothetical protein
MQVVEALFLKGRGLSRRIRIEHRRPRHVPMNETNALALFEINSRV